MRFRRGRNEDGTGPGGSSTSAKRGRHAQPKPDQRLIDIATRSGISATSSNFGLLATLSEVVPADEDAVLVISDDSSALGLAGAIADYWPSARVRLLTSPQVPRDFPRVVKTPVTNIDDVFNAVAAGPTPGLIIEDTRNRSYQRYGIFQKAFLSLRDGGTYVARYVHDEVYAATKAGVTDTTNYWTSVFADSTRVTHANSWERVAADAFAGATSAGPHLVVRKRGQHLMKISNLLHKGEARVEGCLTRRCGDGAVERIASIPPRTWETRSDFETTDESYAKRYLKDTYKVRELVAKAYGDAVVAPRQVITMSGLLLPESSMQPLVRPMLNRFITDAGADYALDPRLDTEPRELPGTFFHLDNEYPGHYGHFTSQDLTKLWAWDDALKYDPDCRLLLSPPHGRDDLHAFQYRLLEAFGIPKERIEVFTAPVRVERLVSATFALQNPYFASPVCKDVWGRIREQMLPQATVKVPERVFIGRGGRYRRQCLNSDQVERVFVDNGFEVVYPETLDIADQIKLFSQARAVAGYAGSGMFTMAYSVNHPTWIVVGSKSYTATTEYLFAGLYDDPIRYIMCDPEIEQPATGWSSAAYFSDYRFNFQRDGRQLNSILARL